MTHQMPLLHTGIQRNHKDVSFDVPSNSVLVWHHIQNVFWKLWLWLCGGRTWKIAMCFGVFVFIFINFCAGRCSRASREGQSDPLCRSASMSWYPIICFLSKSIASLALSTSRAPSANTEDGELRSWSHTFQTKSSKPYFSGHRTRWNTGAWATTPKNATLACTEGLFGPATLWRATVWRCDFLALLGFFPGGCRQNNLKCGAEHKVLNFWQRNSFEAFFEPVTLWRATLTLRYSDATGLLSWDFLTRLGSFLGAADKTR